MTVTELLRNANATMAELMLRQKRAMRLMYEGIVGRGTIISMRETGATINNDPEVVFEIAVELPDRPEYRVFHTQAVSRLVVGRFEVGAGVPVRVDPSDPDAILIA